MNAPHATALAILNARLQAPACLHFREPQYRFLRYGLRVALVALA